jgi:hypothetical protein
MTQRKRAAPEDGTLQKELVSLSARKSERQLRSDGPKRKGNGSDRSSCAASRALTKLA